MISFKPPKWFQKTDLGRSELGKAITKTGENLDTPEGRAIAGAALGGVAGPLGTYIATGGAGGLAAGAALGGLAGAASTKQGQDFLKRATTMPSAMDPSKQGAGERATAESLAGEAATRYGDISRAGIKKVQAMQAPKMAPAAQAAGVAPLTLEERVAAPQIGASQAAQAAQIGGAATISPGFQQYIAGLSPEQIQAAQLERTAAAGPAQIQAAEEGRTFQQALAQQLMGQATGQAPSLAEIQLQQAQDRALKQQIAQAASVRGGPAAAAQQRQLGAQLAETQQAQLAQAAEARIKEQQAAQQTLGQVAGTMRAGDVELATEQARLQQQAALEGRKLTSEEARTQASFVQEARRANQAAINDLTTKRAELTLRAQQGDQQAINELAQVQAKLDTEVSIDNARRVDDLAKQQAVLEAEARKGNQQAAVELQKLNAQLTLDMQKFNASEQNELAKADADTKLKYQAMKNDLEKYYTSLGYDAQQAQVKTMLDIAAQKSNAAAQKAQAQAGMLKGGGDILSGVGSAITAMVALSDVNVKTNIKSTSLIKDLAKAKPYEYDYKSTEFGAPGKHQSLMAQDIEKIPFLKKIILETEKGKAVDYGKALPSMLAAQAEMAKEILELKKKRGK